MSLKYRIICIVLISAIVYGALDFAVDRMVVMPSFAALEQERAERDMERCEEAIRDEVHHLGTKLCLDWAAWDETYTFIEDRNANYATSNLNDDMFRRQQLNLVYYAGLDGTCVYTRNWDAETGAPLTLPSFPQDQLPADHPLLKFNTAKPLIEQQVEGLITTKAGVMLVASRPVLKSDGTGPSRGALIMGRLLSKSLLASLNKQTRLDFSAWPVGSSEAPDDARAILTTIKEGDEYTIHRHNDDTLRVCTVLNDINGKPALWLKADIQTDITGRGATALMWETGVTAGAGFVMMILLLGLLERGIVKPIRQLIEHTRVVAKQTDLSARLMLDRHDEIGQLANHFDRMLSQLDETQDRLVASSYYEGIDALMSHAMRDLNEALAPVNDQIALLRDELNDAVAGMRTNGDGNDNTARVEALATVTRRAADTLDEVLGRTMTLGTLLSDPRYYRRAEPHVATPPQESEQ